MGKIITTETNVDSPSLLGETIRLSGGISYISTNLPTKVVITETIGGGDVTSSTITEIVSLSQEEYDALVTKSDSVIYFII
jgi:hypothetical protein